jgi:hypothetical protein
MAGRQAHNRFPRSWRVTLFDVVVDEALVARGAVEAFTQIFEEDPHKQSANR